MNCLINRKNIVAAIVLLAVLSLEMSAAFAENLTNWSPPVNVEALPGSSPEINTPFNDGCPIASPDGRSLFIATNRPGSQGLDIWVAPRTFFGSIGTPVRLPAPVNSEADDFCPTPVAGGGLFFVSSRAGGCGSADIYFTRFENGAWTTPQNLGCNINSPGGEASPSYYEDACGNGILYFSSNRAGGFAPDTGPPDSDIYFSLAFGPAQLAPGLNSEMDDSRPNVRRDGLEIVFDSTRPGTLGGPDIWTAKRETPGEIWFAPVHLDAPVNSSASETRASLTSNGLTMYFGSTRPGGEGSNDVYVTRRDRIVRNPF